MPRAAAMKEDLLVPCARCAATGFEPAVGDQVDPQGRAYAIDPDTNSYLNCTACDGEGRSLSLRRRRSR